MACSPLIRLLRVCALLLLVKIVCSVPRNITVDDEYGDEKTGQIPIYVGERWNQGATCSGCAAQPNKYQAFRGTWHDTSLANSSVQVTFNGTALYAYIILMLPYATSLLFSMDGLPAGSYNSAVSGNTMLPTYAYNVLAYTNESLPYGEHTFLLQAIPSLLLFDYLVYTYDPDLIPPQKPSSTPSISTASSNSTILGATFGSISVVILLLLAFILLRRQSKHHATHDQASEGPPVIVQAEPSGAQIYQASPTLPAGAHRSAMQNSAGPLSSVPHWQPPASINPHLVGPTRHSQSIVTHGRPSAVPVDTQDGTSLHMQIQELRREMERLQAQAAWNRDAAPQTYRPQPGYPTN